MVEEDRILKAVLSVQERQEGCSKMLVQIMQQFQCTPQVVEVRKGGQTVQIGIEWIPNEVIQAPNKGAIITPFRGG
jgi:hypothetical protein